MVPADWSPNGTALYSYYDCVLSQIHTCPDRTLDVARMQAPINNQVYKYIYIYMMHYTSTQIHKGIIIIVILHKTWHCNGGATCGLLTSTECRPISVSVTPEDYIHIYMYICVLVRWWNLISKVISQWVPTYTLMVTLLCCPTGKSGHIILTI